MRAYRITDYNIPLAILSNPIIAAQIHEDGSELEIPDLIHEYWVGIEHKHKILGCYRIHPHGAVLWQLHARILPEYRKQFSVKASIMALKWAAKNIPNLNKIVCFVPEAHVNVAQHATEVGLQLEGVLAESYLRGGKLIGQDILSITKEQIEKL